MPAPRRTGRIAYEVTVATADAVGAGTDSDVQARISDVSGRTSAWTVLDTSGHDDFEEGGKDTYLIAAPPDFGRPASLQLWKGGHDAWAVEADVRVAGPDRYESVWRPAEPASRLWITGGESPPADGSPVFTAYTPDGTLSTSRR
ncbi:PLAT/LH2 domain-containing protein [Streptomyces sp. NPDC048603]|uniref:PLAT/LH2 domain-containing protein n=1 Tax=Streptomyces sp. NPDC048603 TaxID=3365577 RepID=UPI00371C381F